jgi:uncharacterized protein YuzE
MGKLISDFACDEFSEVHIHDPEQPWLSLLWRLRTSEGEPGYPSLGVLARVLGSSNRIKMRYDPGADAFYLSLTEIPQGAVHCSEVVALATVLDYDEDGNLLGIEVYAGVAERVDLSRLVTKGFSFEEVRQEEWD